MPKTEWEPLPTVEHAVLMELLRDSRKTVELVHAKADHRIEIDNINWRYRYVPVPSTPDQTQE